MRFAFLFEAIIHCKADDISSDLTFHTPYNSYENPTNNKKIGIYTAGIQVIVQQAIFPRGPWTHFFKNGYYFDSF